MRFCKYKFIDGYSRGQICGAPIIATCDRSKPSEPVEFRGTEWTEKTPQTMMMYPTADTQSDFCFWHQRRDKKDITGKES